MIHRITQSGEHWLAVSHPRSLEPGCQVSTHSGYSLLYSLSLSFTVLLFILIHYLYLIIYMNSLWEQCWQYTYTDQLLATQRKKKKQKRNHFSVIAFKLLWAKKKSFFRFYYVFQRSTINHTFLHWDLEFMRLSIKGATNHNKG